MRWQSLKQYVLMHALYAACRRTLPHLLGFPGTTKALPRQRVPASTNEVVAMPIQLATLTRSGA